MSSARPMIFACPSSTHNALSCEHSSSLREIAPADISTGVRCVWSSFRGRKFMIGFTAIRLTSASGVYSLQQALPSPVCDRRHSNRNKSSDGESRLQATCRRKHLDSLVWLQWDSESSSCSIGIFKPLMSAMPSSGLPFVSFSPAILSIQH